MTRIGIVGAAGRMGRAVAAAIEETEGARLAGGAGHGDDVGALARASDVLVDFSAAAALEANLAAAAEAGVPIVVGTTGLGEDAEALIEAAAERVAVLRSANMSLGVNLLAHLVREAAARLGDDWDIEIAEMHHRHKADAPSGTALLLGRAAAEGRGVDLAAVSDRGRDGMTGPRAPGHIGFAALRGGSVAGDHQVIFAAEGERIELGHRAESRDIFARGAVRAALWLAGKRAGRYAMTDVLGI
ncbi:MAG TPA: 4-hydroxy-tetrahydrodipicolinate reductase [Allosphingosinicella sp.]|nr:4-hydroxy-tetrahydrodipicolinate reductase [Allosphingosinicella sp.]